MRRIRSWAQGLRFRFRHRANGPQSKGLNVVRLTGPFWQTAHIGVCRCSHEWLMACSGGVRRALQLGCTLMEGCVFHWS